MKTQITNYMKAGYSGLYITSFEEARVEAVVVESVNDLSKKSEAKYALYVWSCTEGLVDTKTGKMVKFDGEETYSPMMALAAMFAAEAPAVFILRDVHLFIESRDPGLLRKMKDFIKVGKGCCKHLIVVGCRTVLPPELEKELAVIEFELPDETQLGIELDEILGSVSATVTQAERERILAAAKGLTTIEAQNAFALSITETKRVDPKIVYREKCSTLKKNGLLEVMEANVTLDDIGGLENLKADLLRKRDAFGKDAEAYGLDEPRGFLAVGQPGTGKTLTAKACGSVFGHPILRLDASRLYGSLVGQTEGNWRMAHATARAMAPVTFFIDEVDGAMSGGESSGQTDGGTTSRVIKSILQDMQDNSKGIFYVLTANDIDKLPSPLLRRLDDVWNVELPTLEERKAIFRIQIAKRKRKPEVYDLDALAAKTEGYSGAEIEKVVKASLYIGFADNRREPTTEDLLNIIEGFIPLSKTMAADIEKRRKRLEGVAKLASAPTETPKASTAKKVRKVSFAG